MHGTIERLTEMEARCDEKMWSGGKKRGWGERENERRVEKGVKGEKEGGIRGERQGEGGGKEKKRRRVG